MLKRLSCFTFSRKMFHFDYVIIILKYNYRDYRNKFPETEMSIHVSLVVFRDKRIPRTC